MVRELRITLSLCDQAVGRGCAVARAVGLRSTREGSFSGTRLIRMDSIIADLFWALLYGVTAGRLGRRNGPKSAERRLKAFRGGGWAMIPHPARYDGQDFEARGGFR